MRNTEDNTMSCTAMTKKNAVVIERHLLRGMNAKSQPTLSGLKILALRTHILKHTLSGVYIRRTIGNRGMSQTLCR